MKFTFVTLFENLIKDYFEDSILKRACDKSLINVEYINPRDFSKDKHKKTDDTQAGGGAGMLMSPQPLFDVLEQIKKQSAGAYFVFPLPAGKPFKQIDAKRLSGKEHIVFVNGRYEGMDERIVEMFADEIFSIGDYILTGGELPSLVMCDSICRNIDGVLGNKTSLEMESYEDGLLEAPAFTKPNDFKGKSIPSEFLKGNHGKISALKNELSFFKTQYFRPDLYEKCRKNKDDR